MTSQQTWRDCIMGWLRVGPSRPKRLVCVIEDKFELHPIREAAGGVPVRDASEEWEIMPEVFQIIAGDAATLVSGALNRGYGIRPARWPIRFGLLNNDVRWCGSIPRVVDDLTVMRAKLGTVGEIPNTGKRQTPASRIPIDKLFNTDDGKYSDVHEFVGRRPHAACQPEKTHDNETTLWITLAEHSSETVKTLKSIRGGTPAWFDGYLEVAARYHDWAKAHPTFKDAFLADLEPSEREERSSTAWAKRRPRVKTSDAFFHDLVGGCAMISSGMPFLPSYLVLSHHGRFRTGIPDVSDSLPATDLGDGVVTGDVKIEVCERMHRARFTRLYRQYGPFVLAYLEALLRVADIRTSRNETCEDAGALTSHHPRTDCND